MTPSARIAAAIQLLETLSVDRPADVMVTAYFRSRRYIGSKDRADIAERVYRALRHRARFGWWLDRLGQADSARARMIVELALLGASRAAAIAELFDGSRYGPEPFAEAEQTLAAALDGQPIEHPDMPTAIRVECPAWAAEPLQSAFGNQFAAELSALLQPAPFDLRVNELKAKRDGIAQSLRKDGLEVAPTPLSPVGLRVSGRAPLAGHRLTSGGVIEVQDEGSQIVALLLDAKPGQQVADFCAGAGGKALAIAARMQGKGRVVACDVDERRLSRAKERLHRSGLNNIETKVLRSERDPWISRQKGKFDRVLVDAPCTGSGAWRRHPDARWRPVDLPELTALQGRILDGAARLVKPGGLLVYATCSLLPAENEDRIAAFLADHRDFETLPIQELWARGIGGDCPTAKPTLLLTPARNGTDGFFVAAMRRCDDGDEDRSCDDAAPPD